MFDIHPSAKENFDLKAREILRLLEEHPLNDNKQALESEIHIAATITEADWLDEPKISTVDYRGNTIARYFIDESRKYGLSKDNHSMLVKLSEQIQSLPTFRDKISQNFIEENLFKWIKDSFTIVNSRDSFIDALIEQASDAIQHLRVHIPISNLIVEQPFKFGGALITNLNKSVFDEMSSTFIDKYPNSDSQNISILIEKLRNKYQGYASVELELHCEPEFAEAYAFNTSVKLTNLLCIYSGAVLDPHFKCLSRPKGIEKIDIKSSITFLEDGSLIPSETVLDNLPDWVITPFLLDKYSQSGLSIISNIVTKTENSAFEETVINMALLYSKAAFTSDPMEKLVHILSALEVTLLKNGNEPIQQNIGDRLAFFISTKLQDRKNISKNFKKVYGFRSAYIHHGNSSDDLEVMSEFFLNVWIFYVMLVTNSHKFRDKSEFIEYIDDTKYS